MSLAAAVANHERLRFRYRSADGTESKRLVEPHRLVADGRRWYLVAYDNDRDDWRIFRIDRIRQPLPTGLRITPRNLPDKDAATFVARRRADLGPTYRAVATVQAPAGEVARRLRDTAASLEPIDAHRCRLHSEADTLEWLAFRLILLGYDFVVHEPPELIDYLRLLGPRVTRAAMGTT